MRPLVDEMDEQARLPRDLIDRLFALGVMGIQVPESLGGQGGRFFHAVLAVEELSRVDPAVGVFVDVQNTLVINAILRWGTTGTAAGASARPRGVTQSAPTRCRRPRPEATPSRCRRGRAPTATLSFSTAASSGSRTPRKPTCSSSSRPLDPAAGYRGITAFLVDRTTPGLTIGRREHKLGIRASSTCESCS